MGLEMGEKCPWLGGLLLLSYIYFICIMNSREIVMVLEVKGFDDAGR